MQRFYRNLTVALVLLLTGSQTTAAGDASEHGMSRVQSSICHLLVLSIGEKFSFATESTAVLRAYFSKTPRWFQLAAIPISVTRQNGCVDAVLGASSNSTNADGSLQGRRQLPMFRNANAKFKPDAWP